MSDERPLVLYSASARDQHIQELRGRLAAARHRTRGTLVTLRAEIAEKADWRVWFRARPVAFLSAAFVAGFVLARRS